MTDTMTPGRALAQWWAEQLGAPKFDAGDDTINVLLTVTRGTSPAPMAAELAAFVERLTAYIDERVEKSPVYGVTLSTDYGPEGALYDAAEAAGIGASRFPVKTMTHAYPDYVTTSLGYGANSVLLWSREGWERPTCHTRHYEDDRTQPYGYRILPEKCGLPRWHEEREHGAWVPMTEEELAR